MSLPTVYLDRVARSDAIDHYEALYDHFATKAQEWAGVEDELEHLNSATAAAYLFAADAERNNPAPRAAPDCGCLSCARYRRIPPAEKPVHPLERIHA